MVEENITVIRRAISESKHITFRYGSDNEVRFEIVRPSGIHQTDDGNWHLTTSSEQSGPVSMTLRLDSISNLMVLPGRVRLEPEGRGPSS